ncbi:MAG: hypothetical protein CVT49_01415 [candidate division Zixibacteria bacterium HGW-Zixibacteria-1]|nr:MAG: hypothetical protein CVT49_01415 [candidate division Zixibacteria bacterium HGW-Zixibacteria-1]
MDHFLSESEKLYEEIHAQDPTKPEAFNPRIFYSEKIIAKASFLMGMTAIEAFANFILKDYSVRDKKDLPKELLNKAQISQKIDRWPLASKIYFLPTLCNPLLEPPAFYFNMDSIAYKTFRELVEIRNGMLHITPQTWIVLIKLKTNKRHELHDDFPENFWPVSHIFRDYSAFNYIAAKIARDNICWVRDSLLSFIEKIDKKYLNEEKYHLISGIIPEEGNSKEILIDNWQKYVNEK